MRGQFFVISSVIIMTSLVLITQYLHDFGKTNLAAIAELRETDYVRYVQAALENTANSSCSNVHVELDAVEELLKTNLAERGIQLTTSHSRTTPFIDMTFSVASPGFSSQTAFTATCIP